MDGAVSRGFQVLTFTGSSAVLGKRIYKRSLGLTKTSWAAKGFSSSRLRTVVQAQERPIWLPGLDPPPYLDGTLAGDFGFDPLGLGEDPENLKWYVQAELVHSRFAMAGVVGILVTDLLRVTGLSNLPVWYEAGATKFSFASTRTLFIIQLLLMGFVETKRYMDFVNTGSQAKEGSFFGLEAALEGLEPGYPGGPLLNPLGLAKDIKNAHEWKLKEIKNGMFFMMLCTWISLLLFLLKHTSYRPTPRSKVKKRKGSYVVRLYLVSFIGRLAMVAMLGIFVQASVTHAGPIENLVEHLSNPWHKTIIQTLAGSGS